MFYNRYYDEGSWLAFTGSSFPDLRGRLGVAGGMIGPRSKVEIRRAEDHRLYCTLRPREKGEFRVKIVYTHPGLTSWEGWRCPRSVAEALQYACSLLRGCSDQHAVITYPSGRKRIVTLADFL